MKIHGSTNLFEFMGDRIVYRNVEPADPALPGLAAAWREMGLAGPQVPRKADEAYGQAIAYLLRRAHPGIERLLYVGDTRLLDGTAFANILQAGSWPGRAFMADEKPAQAPTMTREGTLFLANRWSLLGDFLSRVEAEGLVLGPQTALVIDVDKTTLGARGRNDGAVDRARVDGVRETVSALLGPRFDQAAFARAYGELNQPAYHSFTADNQDYLAYICLAVGAGMIGLQSLVEAVQRDELVDFPAFLAHVAPQAERSEVGLWELHREIARLVAAGDPTPFKAFRRREYLATMARLGKLAEDAPIAERLSEEIMITQEVREAALAAGRRGALVFGLSDKPDEASFPTEEARAAGYQPLHRTPTHAYGDSLPAPWGKG